MISCDGNDGVIKELFLFERFKEPAHERVDEGDRIGVAVFNRLNVFLGESEIIDLFGDRFEFEGKIIGETIFRVGRIEEENKKIAFPPFRRFDVALEGLKGKPVSLARLHLTA